MADFSNTRINMSLFQQLEEDRKSDKAPATGALEISVADLSEFFSLALALKPVDNWKASPASSSAAPSGTARPRTANPGNPSA